MMHLDREIRPLLPMREIREIRETRTTIPQPITKGSQPNAPASPDTSTKIETKQTQEKQSSDGTNH
jgi:hypothetical protein